MRGMKRGGQLWICCLLCCCCTCKTPLQIVQRPTISTSECSTWSNFHFQTFDRAKFDYPGTCHYIFASHCNDSYQDFNIQIRRSIKKNVITFTAAIDGILLVANESGTTLDGKEVPLPFSSKSVLIEDMGAYFQVTSKLGLTLKWNWGDTLRLDLEDAYKGKTCGLCGNYDGIEKNDLILHGYPLLPKQFGNLQKIQEPSDNCPDVPEEAKRTGRKQRDNTRRQDQCNSRYKSACKQVLSRFGNCPKVVAIDDYVTTCFADLCSCPEKLSRSFDVIPSCVCSTLSQYSRDCVLKGGNPGKWRSKKLCFQECSNNLEYKECGNPCTDTCSNPERSKICKASCTDGCFCPQGTILNDIDGKRCIPIGSCPCTFQSKVYATGEIYSTPCQNCTCMGGKWSCLSLPCSGNCRLEGGFHITTFDKKPYIFHGNCHYLLAKDRDGSFVIIGEIVQCGASSTLTCLKNILITLGAISIRVCSSGDVYVNTFSVKLPIIKDAITLFRPSTFYVNIVTSTGVQIQVQLKPIMQVFITIDETYYNRTSGLCGNFNNVQADDFRTISGIVEDSASAFGNSWKTMASCMDVQDSFEDPCLKSLVKEKFSQHWCARLLNTSGIFAGCHSVIDPAPFVKNCAYDTCNAEKSEEALCSVFSAYARNCVARGIHLKGWRSDICDVSKDCPKTMVYSYEVTFCNSSCHSLSESDVLCNIQSIPVEGCGCPQGTYLLATAEECVAPENCPCYHKDMIIPPGNSFQHDALMCKCIQGRLDCIGDNEAGKDCSSPMYYFDCSSASPGSTGSECQKSCKTQDMQCYGTECVSGCVCPDGLVYDGKGRCIEEEQCPCTHGENVYDPGTRITVNCNTCTCHKRHWNCTNNPCHGICTVYGNGHYLSFDGEKFDFIGDCDYILAQDFCPSNHEQGTFQIVMQNSACGKKLTVCSLKINVFLQNGEIRLREGKIEEIIQEPGIEKNYNIFHSGIYTVIETFHGMTFMWDQKTAVIVQVASSFQGKVCGLCGDFDNSANNDFTTRGQSVEMHAQIFGNSWKVTSSCPDVNYKTDPCASQPSKLREWQKHCRIIKSIDFEPCHNKINPTPYYESCVSDSCGCDNVRDCECFCTAVAAYARSCGRAGICVEWRSPKICPVFCDSYNLPNKRKWHYKPCGDPCLRTCRNPAGKCGSLRHHLEGCYPVCTAEKPYYDEEKRKCVSLLECSSCDPKETLCLTSSNGCTRGDGLLRQPGETWEKDCQICSCSKLTLKISCSPHICAQSPPITCTKEGFVPRVRPHSQDPCCTETVCECDVRSCSTAQRKCSPGFQSVITTSEGGCCPNYSCTPKGVCVAKGIEYQPGSSIQTSICDECVCTEIQDPKTQINQIKCTPIKCPTECQQGFRYIHKEGKCCGECIQVACAAKFSSGMVAIKVGNTYKDPQDNCTQYRCTNSSGQFILSSTEISCPVFEQSNCIPGTTETTPDGCCETCLLLSDNCKINLRKQHILHKQCKSAVPILVTSCEGSCNTYSVYSFVTNKMKHRCTCCHATRFHQTTVQLVCRKRRRIKYTYISVDECGCVETVCPTKAMNAV